MNFVSARVSSILVHREPVYFQDGENTFFGWYHTANSTTQRDCVAVICNPLGYEYAHSHRSIRHLADRMAQQGIPAIRFDYHGTGDAPGTDLDADRWQQWQNDIQIAIQRAREISGRKRVCLLGLRLGATLAALVASRCKVDFLVLWNPCINGKRYLREIQTIALTGGVVAPDTSGALESAGFVISAQTIAAIRNVNLLDLTGMVLQRALVVDRDDFSPDQSLSKHFAAMGVTNDHVTVAGYAAMMAEPQFTVVPDAAFSTIIDWIVRHSECPFEMPSAKRMPSNDLIKFPFQSGDDITSCIEERFCRFGDDQHLFGILSRITTEPNRPAVVLFNAGAVHHIGPNRLYVTLARSLAALGFATFRFDLEGIGDSVHRHSMKRENHPYPDTAIADAQAALDYLKGQFGYQRFIGLGLCSGAHTAFHAGLAFEREAIAELILINPLTFYWVEGMSLETSRRFQEVSYYKQSVKNPGSWLKLLSGKVNILNLVRVAMSYFGTLGKSYLNELRKTLGHESGLQLSRDLKKLIGMNRRITVIVAEGDPGRDILIMGARRTVSNAQKRNQICLQMIADADHTFTQSRARQELIRRLGTLLTRQYGEQDKL